MRCLCLGIFVNAVISLLKRLTELSFRYFRTTTSPSDEVVFITYPHLPGLERYVNAG